jgi:hypothetical protein
LKAEVYSIAVYDGIVLEKICLFGLSHLCSLSFAVMIDQIKSVMKPYEDDFVLIELFGTVLYHALSPSNEWFKDG